MKLKILGSIALYALVALNLWGSDVDSSEDEDSGIRIISAGTSHKFVVGNIEGYGVLGLGSFNIKIPYKKISAMIVKNISAKNIEISVAVDRDEQFVSVTDLHSPIGTVKAKVPKVVPGLTLQNTSCGIGVGAIAEISFD